jgi:hypothetical protein
MQKREEYQRQQERQNTADAPEDDLADITPSFSLPLYMETIGYPDNFRYYSIRSILAGNHGEATWDERFASLCRQLEGGLVANGLKDVEYLQKVALGLQKAINAPGPSFPVAAAQRAYEKFKDAIIEDNLI